MTVHGLGDRNPTVKIFNSDALLTQH